MALRIVMLGDIVGRPGRQAVAQQLPTIREQWRPHLVIANAENSASGSGLTPEHYRKLTAAGIDAITLGDHVYKRVQIVSVLESESNIIRPANLAAGAKGRRWMQLQPQPLDDEPSSLQLPPLYVMTVLGRIMVSLPANDPFATVDQLLTELPRRDPLVLVEVHAEATSEKIAMGWHLDGRVAAVVGTHTHVPTADAHILEGGTAYISDVGMTGDYDSVIGMDKAVALRRFRSHVPGPRNTPALGEATLCALYLEIDDASGRATRAAPLRLGGHLAAVMPDER